MCTVPLIPLLCTCVHPMESLSLTYSEWSFSTTLVCGHVFHSWTWEGLPSNITSLGSLFSLQTNVMLVLGSGTVYFRSRYCVCVAVWFDHIEAEATTLILRLKLCRIKPREKQQRSLTGWFWWLSHNHTVYSPQQYRHHLVWSII